MNPFASIGRATLTVLAHIGRLAVFTGQALAAMVSPPIYTRLILAQMVRIGYFSLPVVGLTAFFTGGVLALQIYLGGNRFGAEAIVPQAAALAKWLGARVVVVSAIEPSMQRDPNVLSGDVQESGYVSGRARDIAERYGVEVGWEVLHGDPKKVTLPSSSDNGDATVTRPASKGASLAEGDVALEVGGRPVLVLPGNVPMYRDIGPGDHGELQLGHRPLFEIATPARPHRARWRGPEGQRQAYRELRRRQCARGGHAAGL